jgi:hypothetical protein
MAHARVHGSMTGLTYLETNNGGTGAAGFWLAAVNTATGAIVWEVTQLYPSARSSANPPVPESGVPGGATAIGTDTSGMATRVIVPSLYGELWQYAAGNGVNPLGAGVPLVRFTSDHHPVGAAPTIYQNITSSRLYAIALSGGYVDPIGSTWSPAGTTHYMVSAAIEASTSNAPITESSSANADRAFVQSLGVDNRGTAQAVVSGDEVFVVTDSSDFNDASTYGATATGALRRFRLDTGSQLGTSVVIAGGGSSIDVTAAGDVHIGSGQSAQKVAAGDTGGGIFNAIGRLIEQDSVAELRRVLWLTN